MNHTRKKLIAGNWKMHGTCQSAEALLQGILTQATDLSCELAVFPPFIYLHLCRELLAQTPIAWGAQNMCAETDGAFTGEISVGMLKDYGCEYVILGHSERRQLFGETNFLVAQKFRLALEKSVKPILCVGETLDQRENEQTFSVLQEQLASVLALADNLPALKNAVIAYEPVWAIGTGKTAAPEQAQEVHAFIRGLLQEYGASDLRILYGGSMKPENARALLSMPDIDGGLIGGAALKADSFIEIAKQCSN